MSLEEVVEIRVERMPGARDLPLPRYGTAGAAGMDLRAAIDDSISLQPGERRLIPAGIRIAIPPGYEGQVRPRSGLALRQGIGMVNSPGTIDSDYRGEIAVILINLSDQPQSIYRGDRIAQIVFAPISKALLIESEIPEDTIRGHGGFGHTGIAT